MVDKIEKPDRPPAYSISGTTETKRDKPREEKGQEDLPTFKKEEPSLYREKFQSEVGISKTVYVPLDQIQKLLFRRATPRHGAPTVEADLVWKDGRTTEGISFLLHNWQDFLKIKNLKVGDIIPAEFWHSTSPNLEVTIRQMSPSGSWNLRHIQNQSSNLPAAPEDVATPWWQNKRVVIGISAGTLLIAMIIIILIAGI